MHGSRPPVHTVASLFQTLCYENKDQLSAGIIVAGWDELEGGQVYNVPLGGGMFRQPWSIGGEYEGASVSGSRWRGRRSKFFGSVGLFREIRKSNTSRSNECVCRSVSREAELSVNNSSRHSFYLLVCSQTVGEKEQTRSFPRSERKECFLGFAHQGVWPYYGLCLADIRFCTLHSSSFLLDFPLVFAKRFCDLRRYFLSLSPPPLSLYIRLRLHLRLRLLRCDLPR